MIRIFTAFPIRNEIAESFLKLSLNNSQTENIRWTPKENLHITLFFIGEIEEANLEEIKNALQNVFIVEKSFSLEFESIIFKGIKHPSMIWASFRKNEFFKELSEKIFHSVKKFMTITPVHHDPIPHCTLARIKSHADISKIDLEINPSQRILLINKAELWQTVQTTEGVRYKSLQQYLMKG